jgi:hypothetical protein
MSTSYMRAVYKENADLNRKYHASGRWNESSGLYSGGCSRSSSRWLFSYFFTPFYYSGYNCPLGGFCSEVYTIVVASFSSYVFLIGNKCCKSRETQRYLLLFLALSSTNISLNDSLYKMHYIVCYITV